MATTTTGRAKRGFAAMSPEKQREIAAKGGRASHGGGRRPGSTNRTAADPLDSRRQQPEHRTRR